MKISVLLENHPSENKKLDYEHGLSLLIEHKKLCILYDTGQSEASYHNALKLGIDPKKITHVILSHGHYDHVNGLPAWLPSLSPKVPVIVGKGFFTPKYSVTSEKRFLGSRFSPQDLGSHPLIEITQSPYRLSDSLFIIKNFPHRETANPIPQRFQLQTKQGFMPDLFQEELALVFQSKKLFLISGCSHNGILNIKTECETRLQSETVAIFGGIHLSRASDERIHKVAQALASVPHLALCHCSGEKIVSETNSFSVKSGQTYRFENEKLELLSDFSINK